MLRKRNFVLLLLFGLFVLLFVLLRQINFNETAKVGVKDNNFVNLESFELIEVDGSSGPSTNTEGETIDISHPVNDVVEPLPPTDSKKSDCYVGGCSGQLCTDREDIISTCEWSDSYACYQNATCERQATGQCGWTDTPELRACMIQSKNNFESPNTLEVR